MVKFIRMFVRKIVTNFNRKLLREQTPISIHLKQQQRENENREQHLN